MPKKLTLEKGKLYQVKNYREGWIIAEYTGHAEAHTARGFRSTDGATSWKEPASDGFRYVSGGSIRIYSKDLQVRELSAEAAEVLARLKQNVETHHKAYSAACKELREFCR